MEKWRCERCDTLNKKEEEICIVCNWKCKSNVSMPKGFQSVVTLSKTGKDFKPNTESTYPTTVTSQAYTAEIKKKSKIPVLFVVMIVLVALGISFIFIGRYIYLNSIYQSAVSTYNTASEDVAGYYQAYVDFQKLGDFKQTESYIHSKAMQYHLGECYYYGDGVEQDYEQAFYWYNMAAQQEDADAEYMVGICYYNGEGVTQDYEAALELFRKSVQHGQILADIKLGDCYYNGYGVEHNYEKAVYYYTQAKSAGNAYGKALLGWCYYYNQGVDQDDVDENRKTAYTLFKDVVDNTSVESDESAVVSAKTGLGCCYANGYGVTQNTWLAKEALQEAADLGSEQAQEVLNTLT